VKEYLVKICVSVTGWGGGKHIYIVRMCVNVCRSLYVCMGLCVYVYMHNTHVYDHVCRYIDSRVEH